ncbi:hypothetical protein ZHAS_00008834 [Anopheles sinensis]|uniref:Uncharacterized protein n=1 Tax=Anopheles sinensis TaxID=74873 RepID=A0A084VTF1_ANOSI|nr:hypothetical protein ZHAS_00008834 [Anopheles sinensis]
MPAFATVSSDWKKQFSKRSNLLQAFPTSPRVPVSEKLCETNLTASKRRRKKQHPVDD